MAKAITRGNFAVARRLMESIASLERVEDSASLDLATMPAHKTGSAWERNRRSDLRFATRTLIRLRRQLDMLTRSG